MDKKIKLVGNYLVGSVILGTGLYQVITKNYQDALIVIVSVFAMLYWILRD